MAAETRDAYDPDLLRHLAAHLGEGAEGAIERAHATARRLAAEWDVEIDGWLPGGTCSLVLTSGETVLRVPLLPWETEASLPTLRAFAEHGGVSLLHVDEASGAHLMPRLRPGSTLDALPEGEAIEAWLALVRRMQSAEGNAPSLATYFEPLWTEPTELHLITNVPALARGLVETSPPHRLLHGDLHHFNVLRSGEGWTAIDPEGVMGDPAYECAAFVRNPVPALAQDSDLVGLLRRRIHRLAEGMEEPAERIWGWALVRTALCVWGAPLSDDPTTFRGAWLRVVRALDVLGPEFGKGLC